MIALSTIGFIIAAILLFLRIVDFSLTPAERGSLKQSVEDFWISIARLEPNEQLQLALSVRYGAMKRLRIKFIYVFWLLSFLATSLTIGRQLFTDKVENIFDDFRKVALFDLDLRRNFLFQWEIANPTNIQYFTVRATDCVSLRPSLTWTCSKKNIFLCSKTFWLIIPCCFVQPGRFRLLSRA
jgi:hypothetical protein